MQTQTSCSWRSIWLLRGHIQGLSEVKRGCLYILRNAKTGSNGNCDVLMVDFCQCIFMAWCQVSFRDNVLSGIWGLLWLQGCCKTTPSHYPTPCSLSAHERVVVVFKAWLFISSPYCLTCCVTFKDLIPKGKEEEKIPEAIYNVKGQTNPPSKGASCLCRKYFNFIINKGKEKPFQSMFFLQSHRS